MKKNDHNKCVFGYLEVLEIRKKIKSYFKKNEELKVLHF